MPRARLVARKRAMERTEEGIAHSVGGALVAIEALIDDDRRENAFGLLMSLNMLIETPGGFDYTGADCLDWLRAAGFSAPKIRTLRALRDAAMGGALDLDALEEH